RHRPAAEPPLPPRPLPYRPWISPRVFPERLSPAASAASDFLPLFLNSPPDFHTPGGHRKASRAAPVFPLSAFPVFLFWPPPARFFFSLNIPPPPPDPERRPGLPGSWPYNFSVPVPGRLR